jgi:hypothetical protein
MRRTSYTATVINGKYVLDDPYTDLPEGAIVTFLVFGPEEREQFVQQNAERELRGAALLTWDEFVDTEILAYQQRDTAKKSLEPLVIYVAREFDGFTYSLDPDSEDRIRAASSEKKSFSRIFMSQNVKEDFKTLVVPIAPPLLQLLTGLSPGAVSSLGGAEFRDPKTDRVLFTWTRAQK